MTAIFCVNFLFAQLSFRENKGQVSDQFYKPRPDILFYGKAGDLNFYLKKHGISYQLNRVDSWKQEDEYRGLKTEFKKIKSVPDQVTVCRIDIDWINAERLPKIIASKEKPGYDNYYFEVCPQGITGVKSYEEIFYKNIYNGIDLRWYQQNENLKYDFIVSPQSDYRNIKFRISGANKIFLNKKNELIIETPAGEIKEEKPFVTQNGKQLGAKWVLKNNEVSFDIAGIDPSQPFIIDPLVRLWGTYYGGVNEDAGWYSASDALNNVYLVGLTQSSNAIATTGAFQTSFGGGGAAFWQGDAMIIKFNSSGVRLWGTYYGGIGSEFAQVPYVEPGGDIYITGPTTSSNAAVMTTAGAYQSTYGGGVSFGDNFIAKFSSAGTRIWSTYYGGAGEEWPLALTGDGSGNIFLASQTSATVTSGIVSPGVHQAVFGGTVDGLIAKFTTSGTFQWGTLFGGSGFDNALSAIPDGQGNIYVVGQTLSFNAISTTGAYQTTNGGGSDGYIAKFNNTGNLVWATYYGGAGTDHCYYGAVDSNGDFYFSGSASSANAISTPGSHQPSYAFGGGDAFLVKFSPSGTRIWGTYYGGNGVDQYGFVTIRNDNIYLVGETSTPSGTSIATPCTYQLTNGGGTRDAFLAKFDKSGVRSWGTFYGGNGYEEWPSVSVNSLGEIYLTGGTSTSNGTAVADPNSHQPLYGGGSSDAYLVKFSPCTTAVLPNTTPPPDMTVCVGENTQLTTTMSVCGLNWFDSPGGNVIGTNTLYTTPTLTSNTIFYIGDVSCGMPDTLTPVEVTVTALPSMSTIASSTVLCAGGLSTLTALGAMTYTWLPVQVVGSVLTVTASSTTIYSVTGFDGNCYNSTTVTVESVPIATLNIFSPNNPACYNSTIALTASGAQTYSWWPPNLFSSSTGSLVNTLPLQASAIYTVVGYNTSGAVTCSTQNTYSLNVYPQIIPVVSPSLEICEASSITISASGGNTYQWSGENIEDVLSPITIIAPNQSGIYNVNISNNNVCAVTASVFVKVNPKPKVFAGNDTVANIGDPLFVNAVGDGKMKWIAGENINCIECPFTQVLPLTKSCYLVEATDDNGCKAQDDICIEIINDYGVYIPNTFTPNDDGINDIFYIYGFGIKNYELEIFNRWGDLLFKSNDQQQGWNGTFKNETVEQGTYIYKVTFLPLKGKQETRTGHVNMIKGN